MTFVLRMSSGMGSADLGKTSFSGVAATQGGFMFEAFLAFFFFFNLLNCLVEIFFIRFTHLWSPDVYEK